MSADNDLHCSKAPTPIPDQDTAKTMIIDRASDGGILRYVLGAFLVLALIAGGVYGLSRNGSGKAASASAETAVGSDKPSENAATAAGSGDLPAECAGEITDAQLRWYCTEFLPFAKKASADHDRLDRLEAERGDADVPLALWLVLAGIGLLTVFNTVKIRSRKDERPPT